jgi:hypothetical protein
MLGVALLARRSVYLGCSPHGSTTIQRALFRVFHASLLSARAAAGNFLPASSSYVRASDNVEALRRIATFLFAIVMEFADECLTHTES